jgi:hypothetical protein
MKSNGARMTQGPIENVFICDGMRKLVVRRTKCTESTVVMYKNKLAYCYVII